MCEYSQAFRYFTESRPILWVGGKPPEAEPKCGFHGEYCVYKPDWRTISVCSIAGAVLAVALFMAARYAYFLLFPFFIGESIL